jgi:SH3-like domain-containing protein
MQKSSRSLRFLVAAQFCGAAAILGAVVAPAAFGQETLTPGSFKAYAAEGIEPRMSDFSGLPVPRYASLRFDMVNGRAGPSPDYPVRWTYERAGLPVVVIRESKDWRKVRDPMGDEVWINQSQLAEQRMAITTHSGGMHRDPKPEAPLAARFEPGSVVSLGACGTVWCPVNAQGQKGWILRGHLWGADPLPQTPLAAPGNR